jgi:WbqC-like protein family
MNENNTKNKKQNIDLQYFGSIKLYSSLIKCTNVFFLPSVPFAKSLHVNRTKLMGANGPLLLTIPLVGGRDKKQLLKDVQISYTDPWRQIHWKGIKSGYSKAPWFEEYGPELENLYQQKEKFLLDWNLNCMQWVIKKLKLKLDILAETDSSIQIQQVENKQIKIVNQPVYQQVFAERHGFVPNLSVLDLLLCEGPLALNYLG